MNDTLAIILGGGQGSRLFPLTATRSKPAVPIGGKYRLIDIPDQRLPARGHPPYLRADAVQFGVAQSSHLEHLSSRPLFSGGFVEILAAEQTPDNPNWYQGTADAVRQAARHFLQHDAKYDLIPRRRPSVPDELRRTGRGASSAEGRHHNRRPAVDMHTATQMGIFRFDRDGVIVGFRRKAEGASSARDRTQHPRRRHVCRAHRRTALHGLDGRLCVLHAAC
jgi:ADP-glucose pyrophosphorylase